MNFTKTLEQNFMNQIILGGGGGEGVHQSYDCNSRFEIELN